MGEEPPPPGDLTPPGPPIEPDPGPAPERRTGALPLEEFVESRRAVARYGDAADPYRPAGPYGGPHRPSYEPPPSRKMAGWALGLSLAFCVPFAFLVAIGLAIAVLVKSRDGRDHGRGMAIAALVISALLVLANIAYLVVVGVNGYLNGWDESERDADGRVVDSGLVSIDRLRVGDCVSEFQTTEEVEAGEWATGEVTVVPCADQHVAEVFAIPPIDPSAYVDQDSLDLASVRSCLAPFKQYVGRAYRRSVYELLYYNPDVRGGSLLEDTVICLVTDPNGPRDTMIKGSRR